MNTNEKIPDLPIKTPENTEVLKTEEEIRKEKEEEKLGPPQSLEEISEAKKKLAELIAATKKSIEEEYKKGENGPAQ